MEGRTQNVAGYTIYLDRRLGKGGFGAVYKATDRNGQIVAAKKMDNVPDVSRMENFLHNNLPEHRNIMKVLNTATYNTEFWLFMPVCEHGDLNRYFSQSAENLSEIQSKLHIMQQIAEGLSFLHDNGIAHRDIKPGNILVTEGDGLTSPHIVISDFNLSKYLDPDNITSGMSTNAGTYIFKAPEFFKEDCSGNIRYHRNVDTFACGLTFLSMMQHKVGDRSLFPYLDNTSGAPEQNERGVGFQMFLKEKLKQPMVDVIKNKPTDSYLVKGIKEVIRKMTQVVPEHRLHMDEVLRLLNNELALEEMGQVIFTFNIDHVAGK